MNIVYFLLISIIISQDCGNSLFYVIDVNLNQFSIYAQTNETMFYSLNQFFSGNNLQYSVDDSFKNDISVIKQLNLLQKEIYHSRTTQEIKSKKAFVSGNGYFLNDFMFLDQDEAGVYITYSQGNHNFSNYIEIPKKNEIFCYDSDYIEKDIFVIDCSKQIDNQLTNLFYLIQSDTQTYEEITGEKISNKPNNRKILVSNQQLFRISMDDKLSTISLFQIQDGQVTNSRLFYIDKTEVERILEKVLQSFTITDAQISNSTLYVLESNLGILEFQFNMWLGTMITVHPPAIISKALSFSISNQRQIVVYESSLVIYKDFVSQNQIQLPFKPIWGKVDSSFAGEYIILNQNYLTYIYFNQNQIATEYVNIETFLANPNIPELIGINNEFSMRFSVSQGYLKFNPHLQPTQSIDQMMLYASNSRKQCQITLYFKVIEKNDKQIYQLQNSLFPNTIWYPTNATQLNTISIGPNMQFSDLQEDDDIQLQFSDFYNIKLDFLPRLDQIAYIELHESDNKFRILLQINNGTTIIYKMNEQAQSFAIDSKSTMPILPISNSFIIWSELSSQLKYFYKATEYSINQYSQGKIIKLIEYPNVLQNRIFSFAVQEDLSTYFILQTYLSRVEVLQFRQFETKKTTIDKELLVSQGYTEEFSPKQLFIIKEIVFIKTEMAILMFHSSEGNHNLYNKIEIKKGAYTELVIGSDNCIIVQKLQQFDSILVYNYQNPSINIMAIKELSLYNNKIQWPIQVVSSKNYFCVRAVNEENKTVILIYSINSLAHESLRKVFSLDLFVPEGEYLQMSISEGSHLYLFVNFNSGYKMWKLEFNPSVEFKISPESQDYVKQYLMAIGVINQFSTLEIYKKIQFIDSHIYFSLNETLFPSIFSINRNTQTTIVLDSTWFTGQIVRFNIYPKYQPESTNVVKIKNFIDQQTDAKYFQYADLTDGAIFDDLTLVFQGPKSLVFAYKSGSLKFEYDFTMKMSLDCICNKLTIQSELIISNCFDNNGNKYIIIHECTQQGCETINMNLRLLNDNEVGKIKLINNYLFILHTNINNPIQYEGTIDIYQFSQKQWIYMMNINSKYLGQEKTVYISDFDIVPFIVKNKNYYKLVLVDIQNGLWQMDLTESLNGLSPEQYNLINFLDSVNLYSNSQTKFLQVRLIEIQTVKNTISACLIVTTNNLMHFRMFMQFDGSSMKFGSSIIKKSVILQTIFNNYFDWECMNSLSLIYSAQLGGKMSVVYKSRGKQQSILVVYEIGIGSNDTVKFKGGLELEQEEYKNDRIIIMDNENEKFFIYSNFERSKIYKEHLVLKYEVLKEMEIVIENKYSLNEWMVIEVSNNFMEKSFDKWFQYRLI